MGRSENECVCLRLLICIHKRHICKWLLRLKIRCVVLNTQSRDGWQLKMRDPSAQLNFKLKYFYRVCKTFKMRNLPLSLQRTHHSVSNRLFQIHGHGMCVPMCFALFSCLDFKCFATEFVSVRARSTRPQLDTPQSKLTFEGGVSSKS